MLGGSVPSAPYVPSIASCAGPYDDDGRWLLFQTLDADRASFTAVFAKHVFLTAKWHIYIDFSGPVPALLKSTRPLLAALEATSKDINRVFRGRMS